MTKNLGIFAKLIVSMLGVLLVGVLPSGIVSYQRADEALRTAAFERLRAVRELKAGQIKSYLESLNQQLVTRAADPATIDAAVRFKAAFKKVNEELGEPDLTAADGAIKAFYASQFHPKYAAAGGDLDVAAFLPKDVPTRILQNAYIASNSNPLGEKDKLVAAQDGTTYAKVHETYHPTFRRFLNAYGYYDIFIADWDSGHVVYSVFKEIDYATSLLTGPHADTGLARAFRAAKDKPKAGAVAFDDFTAYNASYTAAAAFIATPILRDGEPIAALIFQMPIGRINSVMTSDEAWRDVGLGESGETYLVGPDYKLRSESRFLIEDRAGLLKALKEIGTDEETLKTIGNGSAVGSLAIKTQGTLAALKGETSEAVIDDYRGVSVLSAYTSIPVGGTKWALMSEVDEAEILKPVFDLRSRLIVITLIVLLLGAAIAVFVARSISGPLIEVTDRITGLADGELTAEVISDPGGDEIGDLQRAYNTLLTNLKTLVRGMQENAGQLNATAAELLATSQEQQTGVSEQAAAVEETKQTLGTLLESAGAVATVSQTVFDNAEVTQKNASVIASRIGELSEHTVRIGEILSLIKDIANKSELLALNAALEGTKAGEAGRGFSLVANQMQRLAEQVMGSVKNIELLTADITKATSASVLATEEATKLAAQTTASARSITQSVHQQQSGTQQASVAMDQIAQVSNDAAIAAGQVVEAANQLAGLSSDLSDSVSSFKL